MEVFIPFENMIASDCSFMCLRMPFAISERVSFDHAVYFDHGIQIAQEFSVSNRGDIQFIFHIEDKSVG